MRRITFRRLLVLVAFVFLGLEAAVMLLTGESVTPLLATAIMALTCERIWELFE